MAVPVLLSLIAEPLIGLIDTAFVASLGATPLAALGVGTIALTSGFWLFNFLGIGSQSEVAQAIGRRDPIRARQIGALAMLLGVGIGLALIGLGWFSAGWVTAALGAQGAVQADAIAYFNVRLFGAPAVLVMLAAFGVLRGLQDMFTPLWVALLVNGLNILLDWLLIFGFGPVPALGVAGAAWASSISQWLGAGLAALAVVHHLGLPRRLHAADTVRLLTIGGDVVIRTGLLTAFLLLSTRSATLIGANGGAAHQAIRQVYIFTALFLDAFAITGRRVAVVVFGWSLVTGVMLALAMWLGQVWISTWLVPASALALFWPAWWISAAAQPINALAFAADGLLWGAGDYAYMRNMMLLASFFGVVGLLLIDPAQPRALTMIWLVTAVWILLRAALGVLRVWPGIGRSPFTPERIAPEAHQPAG
jgi:MATE family multidrug resistance protein